MNSNNSINRMSYEDRINNNYRSAEAFLQSIDNQYSGITDKNKLITIYNNSHLELKKEKNAFIEKYRNYQNNNIYNNEVILQFKEDLGSFNKKVSRIAFSMLNDIKEAVNNDQKRIIKENTLTKKNKRIEEINDAIDNKENALSNIKGNRNDRKLAKYDMKSLNSELKDLISEKNQLEAQIKNADHPRALESLALASQKASEEALYEVSMTTFHVQNNLTLIDQEKLKEFESGSLREDRHGVIGINGTYRLEFSLSEEKIQKQFKAFINQQLSDKPRKTFSKELEVEHTGGKTEFVPINKEFDEKINAQFSNQESQIIQQGDVHFFGDIFGDKGSSSAQREKHAVNAYFVSLNDPLNFNLYRGIRHAIASNFYEVDPVERARVSKTMSEELFTAWILEEISKKYNSLEEAAEASKINPLKFNFTSVSLVTPDIYRKIAVKLKFKGVEVNEREMLGEQQQSFSTAFKKNPNYEEITNDNYILDDFSNDPLNNDSQNSIENDFILIEDELVDTINIQGHEIRVKINVVQFNFGVNAGAVHYNKFNLGIRKQFEGNFRAWSSLKEEVEKIENCFINDADNFTTWEIKTLTPILKNAAKLKDDIELLMEDKNAYLNGTNQYEVGAKILLLINTADLITSALNSKGGQLPSFCGLFNCKSGKDRTGIMNDVVFTLALMAQKNGSFPSHDELENDPEIREQFKIIFSYMVLNSGSIDITEINTDALGYKVGDEAKLGVLDDLVFNTLKGLSKTTSA